jgi:hypothetical protein
MSNELKRTLWSRLNFEILPGHLPGGAEKITKPLYHNSQFPSPDLKPGPANAKRSTKH